MKKILLPIFAFAFVVAASSCTKCVTCKKADQLQKFCDKDFDKDDQDDAINFYEASGWDCKSSSQMY